MNPPSPELDQWFAQLNPSHIPSHAEVISKVALYARVCRHFVVNSLKKHGPELVRKAQSAAVAAAATSGSAASCLKGQSTSGSPHATSPPSCGGGGTGSNYSMPPLRSLKPGVKGEPGCLDAESNVGASAAANAFHLVIYLVNPFVYSHDYGDVYRLAMLALMRMVKEIKTQFPPELQNCTTFQMVPLSQITGLSRSTGYDAANNQGAALISVDSWNRPKPNHALTLKAMAFDTYTQLRRIPTVQHFNGNRTLTGFGPTAEREELLRAQPDVSVNAFATEIWLRDECCPLYKVTVTNYAMTLFRVLNSIFGLWCQRRSSLTLFKKTWGTHPRMACLSQWESFFALLVCGKVI